MTIRDSLNSISNLQVSNQQTQNKIQQKEIKNHISDAYKLDISSRGMKALESMDDVELAIINSDVLSYDSNLRLTKKI